MRCGTYHPSAAGTSWAHTISLLAESEGKILRALVALPFSTRYRSDREGEKKNDDDDDSNSKKISRQDDRTRAQ